VFCRPARERNALRAGYADDLGKAAYLQNHIVIGVDESRRFRRSGKGRPRSGRLTSFDKLCLIMLTSPPKYGN
jgi:hypothetical protein